MKQLTIASVSAKHVGDYTCVASNKAGSTARTTQLSVNGISSCHNEYYGIFLPMTRMRNPKYTSSIFLNHLNFTVPPQIAPFIIGEEPANWGEQVSVTCSILKGDHPMEIRWTHNNQEINPTSYPDISITKNGKKVSLLLIDSVTARHAGEYTCVASNSAGSRSHSAFLAVNGTFLTFNVNQFESLHFLHSSKNIPMSFSD